MDDALVLIRVGLAGVFAVAALGKLLDLPGSRRALIDFGVPPRLVPAGAFLLPTAELATAVALVISPSAQIGAIAALLLLGAFIAGLTRVLRRGETPDCHCFGQVHSEPASWTTVARNVALAAPALFTTIAGPGPGLPAWTRAHTGEEVALFATSAAAAVLALATGLLWRENRRLRKTQPWTPPVPLRVGARAPRFVMPAVASGQVALEDLLAPERPCVLTFISPGCGPCLGMLPDLARWSESLADRLEFALLSSGDPDEARRLSEEHDLRQVLLDEGGHVSKAYRVPGTPCAVLVAHDGTIASSLATGQPAIEALVRLALEGDQPPALAVTQVA